MKISLCRNDIMQMLSQVKQIKHIDRLEFRGNTVVCGMALDKKVLGVRGVPENWKIELTFSHTMETITAVLNLVSTAETKLGGIVDNIAQGLINGIVSASGLEGRLISAVKLPNFVSSKGKSLTVDLRKLLKNKLNCDVNTVDCLGDAVNLDISFKFQG